MSVKAVAEAKPAPVRSFTPARSPLLQRQCACGTGAAGGECDVCRPHPLQRRASGPGVGTLPPIVDHVLRSPGHPLDSRTRTFMESRLGHDFGQVRVHTDPHAAESARAVNAHAYTVDQDIAFAAGKYDPGSSSGRHLLAHELAHTVQQRGLQRSSDVRVDGGAEYQRLEREADAAADAVAAGDAVTIDRRAAQPTLSRADAGTVTKAKTKKPQTAKSVLGQHTVTPTEVFTVEDGGNPSSLEEFVVEPFYLPAIKGPAAVDIYKEMAGKGLEATLEIAGAKTKTALWQTRPRTDALRDLWLQKVGWTADAADDLWVRAGGTKPFPNVGKTVCQMDHIVELQVGGTNPPENIQPLDPDPNRESGGLIKRQLETLAVDIANNPKLSSGQPTQVKLRFASVKLSGSLERASKSCPPPKGEATCLTVEACARKLKVEKTPAGKVTIAHADYPISAGGRPNTTVKVPTTFASRAAEVVAIEADPVNAGASTLIPGLLLTTLAHQKGKTKKPDVIQARIDDRDKTRLPISLPPDTKPLRLNVAADGELSLDPADKKGGIAFTYKYLSAGRITAIGIDQAGDLSWEGTITPSVKFLGPLAVRYVQGTLSVTKGLDEAELKKRSVLGMQVTKAEVALQLAPFKPTGTIELRMGSEESPLATARLELGADDVGLTAAGKINVRIPKMQSATADITYKGGGGRDEWLTKLSIKSEDVKLGSAVSVSGQLDATIDKSTIGFAGTISATFPNDSKAELGLRRDPRTGWILAGKGTFHAPKVHDAHVGVTYFLADDRLVATGNAGFKLAAINLSGELEDVTFTIAKGGPPKVYGKGHLEFSRGRASGRLDVHLHENGKFSGKGSLRYKLKENLIVTGTVELNGREKLHVDGELLIARYELFPVHADKKDLFSVDAPVPVPGLSIGATAGLVFHIRGSVGVGYSFGPGTIEPLKFAAGFDPLEADVNAKLAVTGTVKVPASAMLSAAISGSLALQVDAVVGSAGAEGGLRLEGDLILHGGAFARLDAAYERQRLTAEVVAGLDTKLLLGLSLSAFVRAWAGAFGVKGELRQDWTLAKKTIDTQLGFYLSAPFSYANDTGIKLPEVKDITLKKPEVTKENLKRILSELFGQSSSKQVES